MGVAVAAGVRAPSLSDTGRRPVVRTPAGAGLLGLQRLAGNRAVTTLLQRDASRVSERRDNADDGHGLSSPTMAGEPQLEECFDGNRVLKQGASGTAATKLRDALTQAGFPTTDAPASYGSSTTRAVQGFQRQAGLPFGQQDGRVGKITIGNLDRAGTSGGAVEPDQDSPANDYQVVDTPAGSTDIPDKVFFTGDSAEPDTVEVEKIRLMAVKALQPSEDPEDSSPPTPGPRPIALLGGASEEGSAGHNTELARRRMARVSALLQQHGHPAVLHTLENRAAEGVGKVDYAKQRSVRMVVGGVAPPPDRKCGQAPCDSGQKTAYEAARSTAVAHVTQARGRLADGTADAHSHVDRLYRTSAATRPATIAALDRQMGLVLDQLGRVATESTGARRTTPGFRCGDPCDCNAVAFNSDCVDAAGTDNLPGEMTLCPKFFTMAAPWRPLLLIHESHHGIAGQHSSDVAYNYTRLLTQLETADALENANSFHALVRLLDRDIYDAIKEEDAIGDVGRAQPDAHDAALDADPALAQAADRTLAVLEQWLTLADFDTGRGHAEIRESRAERRALDSNPIEILSHHFPISRNGQLATEQDQRRVAAIFDRMVRLSKAFDPVLSIGVGSVAWAPGPGTRVTLPASFASMPEPRRVTTLLQALVHATANISAEVEPAYVGTVAAFADRRGSVGT